MNLVIVILMALVALGATAQRGAISPATAGTAAASASATPAPVSTPTPQPPTSNDVISGGNPT